MGAILFVAGWLTQIYTQIIDEDDLYAKENYHDAKAFDEFKAIRPHSRPNSSCGFSLSGANGPADRPNPEPPFSLGSTPGVSISGQRPGGAGEPVIARSANPTGERAGEDL